jgi:RimJ/RimL family protein N-acetyltransferase
MIRGNRVKLRHIEAHELDTVIQRLNDLQLRGDFLRTALVSPQRMRQEYAENGLASDSSERFLIINEADEIIGIIHHFTTVPYSTAREIGIFIFNPQARRKGYATEAMRLLIDYLFESSTVNRLEVRMDTRNVASEQLARRCGFTKEGTLRQSMFVRGVYVDTYLYALLRQEWKAHV